MGGVRISDRAIGPGHPCFVVAEIGTNHDRNIQTARTLIDAAATAGVDAVKFQFYHGEDVVTPRATAGEYGLHRMYPGLHRMVDIYNGRLRTPRAWFPELSDRVRRLGMIPFAAPHCIDCAQFAVSLGMPAFKVASVEITNLQFLEALAAFRKPIILSTGFATSREIAEAVRAVRRAGHSKLILLHCVSDYPTRPQDVNLQFIQTLRRRFGAPVGFSDHTTGLAVSFAAVALGASVIERHVTLDRNRSGPDHPFALEPQMLVELVRGIRDIHRAMGKAAKKLTASERDKRKLFFRSIVASRHIPRGQKIRAADLDLKRPGTGLPPKMLRTVIGRRVRRDIRQYDLIETGTLV
ncbi:MAG: hypothetical protein A3G34_14275 [Candidatus Lindowbacteria bacterium RIFCSPLOWO2_12_FULL_62_27]|nr:MAG: hypothetical protein A3I06_15740 [Candidatus Lindowbacteria bacterium RIFCSPLOWO2_02_FULL_62_12]OGH62730.1 MAG: hypothetical protein A3G34_14275 [Candidatus Lindowbacteria bacterium RIFCSPLOWO2_12_FULL_62_27]